MKRIIYATFTLSVLFFAWTLYCRVAWAVAPSVVILAVCYALAVGASQFDS